MMIKLYQGAAHIGQRDSLVLESDPEQIIKAYKHVINRYAGTLPSPKIYVQYLEMRYYFEINITGRHTRVPVRRISRLLKSVFPQFIWTRIIEHEDDAYRLEFIPVSWSYSDSVNAEQVLSAAISEMGYGQTEFYESVKKQMESLFLELLEFEQDVMQQEMNQAVLVTTKATEMNSKHQENNDEDKMNLLSRTIDTQETDMEPLNKLKIIRDRLQLYSEEKNQLELASHKNKQLKKQSTESTGKNELRKQKRNEPVESIINKIKKKIKFVR